MFSKNACSILLWLLMFFHERVEGPLFKLSKDKGIISDKYCHDEADSDDDYDYDDYDIEGDEDESDDEDFGDFDQTHRGHNRRNWISRLRLKMAKKTRSKVKKKQNRKERKLLKKARKLFRKGDFKEAARCCSAVIKINPNSENYMNRAMCYLNSRNWNFALIDLRTVLAKNPYHVRAHYLLGLVLLELQDLDSAIKHLKKALDVGREKKINEYDIGMIASQLEIARQRRQNSCEQKELLFYLENLISRDTQRQIRAIDEASQNRIEEIYSNQDKLLERLTAAFAECDKTINGGDFEPNAENADIPEYLCDKIIYEPLKEPVITPSGITYEKEAILLHLNIVDVDERFDPITRERLQPEQLVPNKALKEAIDAFWRENDRFYE